MFWPQVAGTSDDLRPDQFRYVDKKIHPLDLKNTVAQYINELLEPIRQHFEKNKKARELKEKVLSFKVTR